MAAEIKVPAGYYYTKGDTWTNREPDGTVRIGITDYAQTKLKKIEYFNLPEEGDEVTQNTSFGEVESLKSVADMISPLTGTVKAVNEALTDNPGLANSDPYGEGWVLEITCENYEEQVKKLMEAADYRVFLKNR